MSHKRPPTPKKLSQKCVTVINNFNKKKCIKKSDMKQTVGCLSVKYRIAGNSNPMQASWDKVKSKQCKVGSMAFVKSYYKSKTR